MNYKEVDGKKGSRKANRNALIFYVFVVRRGYAPKDAARVKRRKKMFVCPYGNDC